MHTPKTMFIQNIVIEKPVQVYASTLLQVQCKQRVAQFSGGGGGQAVTRGVLGA
jgi:hypothetical protein